MEYHAFELGKCDLCCLFVDPELCRSVCLSVCLFSYICTFRVHPLHMWVEEELIAPRSKQDDSY